MDRTAVASFYQCFYVPSEGFESRMNWVGNVGVCTEGTLSQDFHDDTLRRINYYRAMVGLNADISFTAANNDKCQLASLIFARNCGLSHDPLTTNPAWFCLSVDGDEAAGASNISVGSGIDNTGPRAVEGQIEDAGSSNIPVGHRRWLLYPRAVTMGNGGIPVNGPYCSSACIWVIGNFSSPPSPAPEIPWPPKGYVPYQVVYPRWSFSLAGANFNSATVSMTEGGSGVGATKIHPTPSNPAISGLGDPTIVWEPSIPSGNPGAETTYSVTISGVTGTGQSQYTYDVTIIDPAKLGQTIDINGPAQPFIGIYNTYDFSEVAAADSYNLRTRRFDSADWTEGTEFSDPGLIIDGTDAAYGLTAVGFSYQGNNSFHMAFQGLPNLVDQGFEIDRTLLPESSTTLDFRYMRRFSSSANTINAEVSVNDGASWTPVWTVNGICSGNCSSGDWDASWIPASISLAAYDGIPVRVRFTFNHNNNWFSGTDNNYGVFFDVISAAPSSSLLEESISIVAGGETSFVFNPAGAFTYQLDLQALVGCYTFDGGEIAVAQAQAAPNPIQFVNQSTAGNSIQMTIDASPGTFGNVWLERLSNTGSSWLTETGAVYNAPGGTLTTDIPGGDDGGLYRAVGVAP